MEERLFRNDLWLKLLLCCLMDRNGTWQNFFLLYFTNYCDNNINVLPVRLTRILSTMKIWLENLHCSLFFTSGKISQLTFQVKNVSKQRNFLLHSETRNFVPVFFYISQKKKYHIKYCFNLVWCFVKKINFREFIIDNALKITLEDKTPNAFKITFFYEIARQL